MKKEVKDRCNTEVNKVITILAVVLLLLPVGIIGTVNAKEYVKDDYTITLSDSCFWLPRHKWLYGI